jgi:preprotein translocase subunit YajC
MEFLVSNAWAQDGGGQSGFLGLLFPVAILVLFFFLFIRPQQKRVKEHKTMVEALNKGDEVLTNGGLAGNIIKVSDNFVSLQIADNVVVKVQKASIGSLLPKGTLKQD